MILQAHQRVNIVVRGLIFHAGHVLVTQWLSSGHSFPIGGRVEFGEPLIPALQREVREETGAEITIRQLLYFGENVFTSGERQYHEYGWYFWVEPDRHICALDAQIPNPDHDDLIIRYLKIDDNGLQRFVPPFLRRLLPQDLHQGFAHNPRYLYCTDQPEDESLLQEYSPFFRLGGQQP